jgi:hypothetical protein
MTTPIDPVERRLPEALTDLASPRTPDYFIDILGQTARVHQRPAWVRPGRWFGLNGFLGRPALVAVVVVLVAVVGGGIILSQRNQASVGAPTASPTASPVSSARSAASPQALPAALFSAGWLGDHRPLVDPNAAAALRFGSNTVSVTRADRQSAAVLTASAAAVDGEASQFSLETGPKDVACQAGDRGTYDWSLSASGRILTVSPVQDACAARSTAIAGTWWRNGCKLDSVTCLGDLDPGTYPSLFIGPRLDPSSPSTPSVGAMAYTVPAGWANAADTRAGFRLTPSTDFATETPGGPQHGFHEIMVGLAPRANQVTPDCSWSVDTSVATTIDGLLAWIAKQPALSLTPPTAITIDGNPGKWVDVRLAPTWKTTCSGGDGSPERAFLGYASGTADDRWTADLAGQERYRVILLDLGSGHTVAIFIDSSDPARFDDLVSQSMPIINSFKFQ